MNVIGKTTINPVLFFSGKIAGYFTWLAFFMAVFNRPIFTIRILASGRSCVISAMCCVAPGDTFKTW